MTRQTQPSNAFKFFLIALLATILASLACTVELGNGDNNLSIEQTLVALQMTQTALENQVHDDPAPPVDEGEENPPPLPTEEPDVVYEGISFSLNPIIAGGVFPTTISGQNMGEDYMPGDTYPTHFEFTFDTYAVGDHFHTPRILVYPVDEYRAINPLASENFDILQQTLITRPGGGTTSSLPFLPMWPAARIFSAKVEYFDFQNGSGIRYLTTFGQALYPVDNQNLFYTYQGITHDSRYYISAVLPVTNMGLPNDGSSQIDDWMAFENNWENYIADTLVWMEEQDIRTFFPSLDLLDEMMASFRIDR